jgi:hypothetical protein
MAAFTLIGFGAGEISAVERVNWLKQIEYDQR